MGRGSRSGLLHGNGINPDDTQVPCRFSKIWRAMYLINGRAETGGLAREMPSTMVSQTFSWCFHIMQWYLYIFHYRDGFIHWICTGEELLEKQCVAPEFMMGEKFHTADEMVKTKQEERGKAERQHLSNSQRSLASITPWRSQRTDFGEGTLGGWDQPSPSRYILNYNPLIMHAGGNDHIF